MQSLDPDRDSAQISLGVSGRDSTDLLHQAAEKARADSFFLAPFLAAYQETERLDDVELARFLECDEQDLPRLALCRRPAAHHFASDLVHLGRRFGLRADRLAAALRQVEALEAIRETSNRAAASAGAPGLLLAARDQE